MARLLLLLTTFFLGLPFIAQAQISDHLLKQLPDSLHPVDKQRLTFNEAAKIVKSSVYFDLKTEEDKDEVDRLTNIVARNYHTLPSKEQQLKYLWYVVSYWCNRNIYRQTSQMHSQDSIKKYNDIFRKLIGNETDKYETALIKYYVAESDLLLTKENNAAAYKTIMQGIAIAKRNKNYMRLANFSGMNSRMFQSMGMLPQAIAWADSGLRFVNEMRFLEKKQLRPYEVSVMLINKAQTFVKFYQQNRQQAFADSAIKTAALIKNEKHDNRQLESEVYFMLAELSYYQKKYPQSISYADTGWKIEEDSSYSDSNASYYFFKGLSLLELGRETEGKILLDKIDLAESRLGNDEILTKLYEYEKAQGRTQKALVIHERLMEFMNESKMSDYKAEIFGMQQKYDLTTRDAQIDSLKSASTINKLTIAFLMLVAIFVLVLFLIKSKANKQKVQRMVNQMDELTEFHVQQIVHLTNEAKEQERKRISQDLHDDLAGTLAGSLHALRLKQAQEVNPIEARQLAYMCDMIEESYDKTRARSHAIYADVIKDDYWDKLTENIKLFFIGSEIQLNISIAITEELFMDANTKTAILYNIKELIVNVLKHASATDVKILVYDELGKIYLLVTDNGRGLPKHKLEKGLGLSSVYDRCQRHGGEMKVDSKPGKGTTIEIIMPLAA